MQAPYFTPDFIEFFIELSRNNHKEWFDENRKRYEKSIKKPFAHFVGDLIERLKELDPEIEIEPKDAIFRINKDIRFSKDKSPYKLTSSAIVSPSGKKNKEVPGLYIELGPEDVKIYGGVYALSKENLSDLRYHIAANAETFEKLLSEKEFVKKYGQIQGEKNKRLPQGLLEAAEKQPLLYNKSFYFFTKLPPESILSKDFLEEVVDYFKVGQPISQFIRKAIHY